MLQAAGRQRKLLQGGRGLSRRRCCTLPRLVCQGPQEDEPLRRQQLWKGLAGVHMFAIPARAPHFGRAAHWQLPASTSAAHRHIWQPSSPLLGVCRTRCTPVQQGSGFSRLLIVGPKEVGARPRAPAPPSHHVPQDPAADSACRSGRTDGQRARQPGKAMHRGRHCGSAGPTSSSWTGTRQGSAGQPGPHFILGSLHMASVKTQWSIRRRPVLMLSRGTASFPVTRPMHQGATAADSTGDSKPPGGATGQHSSSASTIVRTHVSWISCSCARART